MTFEQWNQNTGRNQYDYAINGIPFLSAAGKDISYTRSTAQYRKDQIDTSAEPGEQSLGGWWYRSQSSCDQGAGIVYFDTARGGDLIARRYADSHNVFPFKPGEVTLLNKVHNVSIPSGRNITYIASYANEYDYPAAAIGSPEAHAYTGGYLVAAENELYRITQFKNGYQPSGEPYRDFSVTKIFELDRGTTPYNPTPDTEITNLLVVGQYYYFTVNANTPVVYRGSVSTWEAPTVLYQASQQIFAPEETRVAGQYPAYQPGYRTEKTRRPNSLLGYAKGLLWITFGSYLWTVSATPTETAPINLIPTVDVGNYNLTFMLDGYPTAIADGPSGVYVSTTSKNQVSRIYLSTIDDAAGGTVLTLNSAYVVAELPGGEEITSLFSYLGTYLAIGTDRGIRFAAVDGSGHIIVGPLNIETDMPVESIFSDGNFVWASGGFSDGYSSLYRIDMSRPTSQQEYRFAWSKDLNTSSAVFDANVTVDSLQIVGIASASPGDPNNNPYWPAIGNADIIPDRPLAFATGHRLYVENTSTQVDSGWIQTGRIRFETSEQKNFEYLRTNYEAPNGGTILVYDDFGLVAATPTVVSDKETYFDSYGSAARTSVLNKSYRFVLLRDASSSSGPIFKGYQVKAQPSGIRQRQISLPLLCMPTETTYNGRTYSASVWDRVTQLEALEESGSTVLFQDFGTGEERAAIIEQVQFTTIGQPTTRAQKADPGGIILVTLRTVDASVKSVASIIPQLVSSNGGAPVLGTSIYNHNINIVTPIGRTEYSVYLSQYPDGPSYPLSAGIATFNNTTNNHNVVTVKWTANIKFISGWYRIDAEAFDLTTQELVEQKLWFELDSSLNIINVSDTAPEGI